MMRIEKLRRYKLRVHWPVSAETFKTLVNNSDQVYSSEDLRGLRDVIEKNPELGDFGDYSDVVEMSFGLESFLVGNAANATLGVPGERCISPTLVVTTYVRADLNPLRVDDILAELISAHPWEIPVIEFSEIVDLISPAVTEQEEALHDHIR